ncbi:MAG: hypothetical protein GYA46_09405 [candidate division Zixibacteria bacterium]|nr:hypothetical protein [candidate division Zixibacteria bacterium]
MKNRWLWIAMASAVVGSLIISAVYSADDEIAIIRTGTYHGNEVVVDSGPGWFGLFGADSSFEVRPVAVAVNQAYDPIIGDSTGKRVDIDRPGEPLLLVTGIERLEAGPVSTSFAGDQFVNLGQEIDFAEKGGYPYSLSAVGEARLRNGAGEMLFYNYSLVLRHADTLQTIIEYPVLALDGLPTLMWAGDLDRDGRLDLILNLTNHYNVDLYVLFLSSEAGPGELVRKVAEFRTVGC